MDKTAEEAMLLAAMEGAQETLDRLAQDTTTSQRRHLTRALKPQISDEREAILAALGGSE